MKNRSSSGISSSSIHGLPSAGSNNHNGDCGDTLESQRLLNDTSCDIVNNTNDHRNLKFLPISILFLSSIVLFYIGWYEPRKLMDRYIDAIIERNTPPYQIFLTDSKKRIIILDSTYNHPVVDPPTISCT